MTVVLDTNALMMPVECDVRLFDELDRLLDGPATIVPEAVVAELEKLSAGGGQEATAANVGLDLVERCQVRETDAAYADDAALELATDAEVTHLVTNDGPLQERALARGISVISLRDKNVLAVTQP